MNRFLHGHAMHADWRAALAEAGTQVDVQREQAGEAAAPTLGFAYFSDHYADQADELLAALRQRWPGVAWVGAVGVGVAASGVEYFDQPALSLMLAGLPPRAFRVFSGARPLAREAGFVADTALVHADGRTPDLAELIDDMSGGTTSGYLFGGLAASRGRSCHLADGVWQGGLSGVAFAHDVALVSRVTQGCQPVGPVRRITACDRNLVTRLDDEPALDCLAADLGISLDEPRVALPRLRATLAGLSDARDEALSRGGQFGTDTRVRHLIGLDPVARGVALADTLEVGMQLTFCQRDVQAARRDLVRICAEIREELTPEPVAATTAPAVAAPEDPTSRIAGAIYVSCAGRGGPHFGAPSAELLTLRQALGDVPLTGFFAGGEIGHHHLYGYTGVLTVFLRRD